ncbi:MAG: hypothetical protein QW416_00055 [Candidatus Nitrosocaldaceae archaeon]
MQKIDIIVSRDVLHYVLERLSSIENINDITVTLTENINPKSAIRFDAYNTTKIEFVIDDVISDNILHMLLTDQKIQTGRIDIINLTRSFILGNQSGKRIKIISSAFIRAPRKIVYNFVTNYQRLQEEMPEYIKRLDVINKSENTIVLEEEISIDGLTFKQIAKHTDYIPAVHEIEIISGYMVGSKIIETFTEQDDNTQIMIVGEFVISKEIESILGSDPKTRIENMIRKITNRVEKIIEERFDKK